jgi:hypothetical protein
VLPAPSAPTVHALVLTASVLTALARQRADARESCCGAVDDMKMDNLFVSTHHFAAVVLHAPSALAVLASAKTANVPAPPTPAVARTFPFSLCQRSWETVHRLRLLII